MVVDLNLGGGRTIRFCDFSQTDPLSLTAGPLRPPECREAEGRTIVIVLPLPGVLAISRRH